MRVFLIGLCLLLLLPAADATGAQSPATARSSDESAVRDVVRRYVEARTVEDPDAINALFTEDADQHTTSGEWRRGRDQVVPGTLRSSANNPGTRRIVVEAVRFITADVAIVDGPYEIGDGANVRRNWTTLVVERQDGAWRITAIRNMVPTSTR